MVGWLDTKINATAAPTQVVAALEVRAEESEAPPRLGIAPQRLIAQLEPAVADRAGADLAGARFLITQLFFDNKLYFDFVARARAIGIDVPIIPGVMPINDPKQIARITTLCGSEIPAGRQAALERRADDLEAAQALGVAFATLQCAELLRGGAPGIHFYTLNRSPATRAILAALKLMRPWDERASGLAETSLALG